MNKLSLTEASGFIGYDPDTGVFRWKIGRPGASAGAIAGSIYGGGYRYICIKWVDYKASRLAFLFMTSDWPKGEMDHIDHCRDNDKWLNLREVTAQKNRQNQSMRKDNTSGITGVYWNKRDKNWEVKIGVSGRMKNLGSYTDKREAISVRKFSEIEHGFHVNHGLAL